MEEFTQNTEMSDILFHEIMKCSNLIRSSLHHRGGKGLCQNEHGHREMYNGGRHGSDAQKIGQIRLLSIVLKKDGINQRELSELLMIAPASVSELLNKLENDNYINRKQNEEDKRVTNIFLTEEGLIFAEKMKANRLEVVKTVFSSLNETEQKQLFELIGKINQDLVLKVKGEDFYGHLSQHHEHGRGHGHQHLCSNNNESFCKSKGCSNGKRGN